ncbi:MAG: hypothetical protein JWQ66_702 [Mucilaginibacter sp.]|nr:hypothetical protein [Mucilaginibacter sp.]
MLYFAFRFLDDFKKTTPLPSFSLNTNAENSKEKIFVSLIFTLSN